jgi:hypothetical protein
MNTAERNDQNNPGLNKTKDTADTFAKKGDVATDAAKKAGAPIDNAVNPKRASESTNQVSKPTDKNAELKAKPDSQKAGPPDPKLGTLAESTTPKQTPKATEKSAPHTT